MSEPSADPSVPDAPPVALPEALLEVRGLEKRYGDFEAVRGIDFTARRGELYTLLGPNGAGKTTTIKVVTGLLRPSAGTVRIGGHDLLAEPVAAKRLLGYIPDRPFFYEKLTAREYVDLVADIYGVPEPARSERRDELARRFALADRLDQLIESFSHGMRQKLAFCATFIHDPQLVMIDEPWVGLDPRAIRALVGFLRERCDAGCAMVVSTHTLVLAQEISDRTGIIHDGRLIAEGTVDEMLAAQGRLSLEDVFLELTKADDELAGPGGAEGVGPDEAAGAGPEVIRGTG